MSIYQPLNINSSNLSLTFKGADDSTFTPLTNIYIDSGISLSIKNSGRETLTEIYMALGDDSFSIQEATSPYSTSVIYAALQPIGYGEHETDAIVQINLVDGQPDTFTILNNGSLLGHNTYFIETSETPIYYQNSYIQHIIAFDNNGSRFTYDNQYAGYILEFDILCKMIDIDILDGGFGYKLGSSFTIADDDVRVAIGGLTDAVLDVKLALHNNTINISGGTNYKVNDTFTVYDSVSGSSGTITVTSTELRTGSILSTILTTSDNGFTDTPTVTYNGSNGSGATVDITDLYTIGDIVIDSAGEAYRNNSLRLKVTDSSAQEYTPQISCLALIINEASNQDSTGITLKDNFLLHSCKVTDSGNNLGSNSVFALTDNHNQYIFTEYFTIGSYIDVADSRPTTGELFYG